MNGNPNIRDDSENARNSVEIVGSIFRHLFFIWSKKRRSALSVKNKRNKRLNFIVGYLVQLLFVALFFIGLIWYFNRKEAFGETFTDKWISIDCPDTINQVEFNNRNIKYFQKVWTLVNNREAFEYGIISKDSLNTVWNEFMNDSTVIKFLLSDFRSNYSLWGRLPGTRRGGRKSQLKDYYFAFYLLEAIKMKDIYFSFSRMEFLESNPRRKGDVKSLLFEGIEDRILQTNSDLVNLNEYNCTFIQELRSYYRNYFFHNETEEVLEYYWKSTLF